MDVILQNLDEDLFLKDSENLKLQKQLLRRSAENGAIWINGKKLLYDNVIFRKMPFYTYYKVTEQIDSFQDLRKMVKDKDFQLIQYIERLLPHYYCRYYELRFKHKNNIYMHIFNGFNFIWYTQLLGEFINFKTCKSIVKKY